MAGFVSFVTMIVTLIDLKVVQNYLLKAHRYLDPCKILLLVVSPSNAEAA